MIDLIDHSKVWEIDTKSSTFSFCQEKRRYENKEEFIEEESCVIYESVKKLSTVNK